MSHPLKKKRGLGIVPDLFFDFDGNEDGLSPFSSRGRLHTIARVSRCFDVLRTLAEVKMGSARFAPVGDCIPLPA